MSVFESNNILIFNKDLAQIVGNSNQAIFLQQVHYWLKKNEENNVNYFNDYFWTQSSLPKMWERDFKEVFSFETLRKLVKKLEEENILISIKKQNRKYYRINYDLINENFNKIDRDCYARDGGDRESLSRDGGGKKYPARDGEGKKYPIHEVKNTLLGTEEVKNTSSPGKKYPIEGYKIPDEQGKIYPTIKENNKYNNIYNNKYIYHHKYNIYRDEHDDKINLFSNQREYFYWFSLIKQDVQKVIDTVLTSENSTFRINKENVASEIVKEKFKLIKGENIDYLTDKILELDYKIGNFESYVISSLYNAIKKREKKDSNENSSLGYDWIAEALKEGDSSE